MFRLQNNVPNVYVDFSRDFQLLCRLYDVVNASVREEVDSIGRLTNTKFIQSNALELLQTKLGFFTKKQFSDRELRFVLSAFPILLKNKGTKKGIEETVNIWVNLNHFNGNTAIGIDNKKHIVYIQFQNDFNLIYDFSILEEVLKYILPTGYFLDISVISVISINKENYGDKFGSLITSDIVNLYTNASVDTDTSLQNNSVVISTSALISSIVSYTVDSDPDYNPNATFDYSLISVSPRTYTLTFNSGDDYSWKDESTEITYNNLNDFGITYITPMNQGDTITIDVATPPFSKGAVDTVRIEFYGNEGN